MPQVSICIPTYNGAKYIKKCIESVLSQTYGDFELIVSDDHSTDNTIEIIRSLRDHRIKIFSNNQNLGIGGNWNRCLELMTGEFSNIFHQDDMMMPDSIKRKVEFLTRHPDVGFVHSNFSRVNDDGKILGYHWSENPKEDCVTTGIKAFERLIFQDDNVCCPSVMIRNRCYQKAGVYNTQFRYALDMEMWGKVMLHHDIGYIAEPLISYRWHEENATHQFQGPKRNAGFREEYLVREILLEKYYIQHKKKDAAIPKGKTAAFYKDMGNFFFWQNEFQAARRVYWKALNHGASVARIFPKYVLTFLPASLILSLKKFASKSGDDR